MGKSDLDIYNSPYDTNVDELIQSIVSSTLTGQMSPSPTLTGGQLAQQIGGTYDAKTNTLKAPDGSTYKPDPSTGDFVQQGVGTGGVDVSNWHSYKKPGGPNGPNGQGPNFQSEQEFKSYVSSGGQVLNQQGQVIQVPKTSTSPYAEQISAFNSKMDETYADPNSPWNTLANAFEKKYYDPETGSYTSETPSTVMSGWDYLDDPRLGGYLNKEYAQSTPYAQKSYSAYDYKAPTVNSVDPVIDSAWESMYGARSKDTEARARDRSADVEDWTARQGSSLASGRKQRLEEGVARDTNRDLDEIRSDVEGQKAFQKYDEAKNVRDRQVGLDWDAQLRRGEENRYGAEFGRDEGRYGYETGRDENRYGYEAGQKQGAERMGIFEGIESQNRDRAFQENQAGKQDTLNQLSYLADLLRVYADQDANAIQLYAAEQAPIGQALGGLMGVAGAVGGGFAGKPGKK